MRKAVLYIAMSIDGYIADSKGGVAWLGGDGSDRENRGTYPRFIKTIDTIIMGYKTYRQIVDELFPGKWVYADKKSYVLTYDEQESTEEIVFLKGDLTQLVQKLKQEDGKDIWICGGADIVNQLWGRHWVDRYHITVIPTILGDGIRLFEKHDSIIPLRLLSTQSYDGMVDLVYENRK